MADVQQHPATRQATVESLSVNGMGGDPLIDYWFTVNGAVYRGSGPYGKVGNPLPNQLQPGDAVTVRYSYRNPQHSCTCEPSLAETTMQPDWNFRAERLLYFVPLAVVPLLALLARSLGAAEPAPPL